MHVVGRATPNNQLLDGEGPAGLVALEVADLLGVNVRHVRRLVQEKRIPYVRWGHLLRFDLDEVEAWIAEHSIGATPTLRQLSSGYRGSMTTSAWSAASAPRSSGSPVNTTAPRASMAVATTMASTVELDPVSPARQRPSRSDVVVELELVGVGAQAEAVDLDLALVGDPGVDEVGGEDVAGQ